MYERGWSEETEWLGSLQAQVRRLQTQVDQLMHTHGCNHCETEGCTAQRVKRRTAISCSEGVVSAVWSTAVLHLPCPTSTEARVILLPRCPVPRGTAAPLNNRTRRIWGCVNVSTICYLR